MAKKTSRVRSGASPRKPPRRGRTTTPAGTGSSTTKPRHSKTPTLDAIAPELTAGIAKAEARRRRAVKTVGGVKPRPPVADAQQRWRAERELKFAVPLPNAQQLLQAAAWYLAEARCLTFTHTRLLNGREGNIYSIPCQACLERATRDIVHDYEEGKWHPSTS